MMSTDVTKLFSVITIMLIIKLVYGTENKTLTDLRRCKLTHKGLHYSGTVAKTAGGIRCQFWETKYPIHKVSEKIVDPLFPEGSKKLAKNYCRNPTGNLAGPWCYTLDEELSDDQCDIPLCYFPDCRLSGAGVEYAGKINKAASGQDCLEWDYDDRPVLYPDTWFPDKSRRKAKSRCRNPTGDNGGPWCFTDSEEEGAGDDDEVKTYCEIPFCDEQDCLVYTDTIQKIPTHSTFTNFNLTEHIIHFGIKLWNPDEWPTAFAYLLLSVLANPGNYKHLHDWGSGVVLKISNKKTGLLAGYRKDDEDDEEDSSRFVSTPSLLSGSNWTRLWVSWGNGFITLGLEGQITPLVITEYNEEKSILGLAPGEFSYYSIAGNGILWSLPFCETDCETQTTSQLNFERIWKMKKTTTGYDVSFFLRAVHMASVELRATPSIQYPNVRVTIGIKNQTQITLHKASNSTPVILKEVDSIDILSYWKWGEFAISTLGPRLFIFWTIDTGTHSILEVEHYLVWSFRWFSIASHETTAHWTLFCRPTAPIEESVPPECVVSESEVGYHGTQWVSKRGKACLPWNDSKNVPKKYNNNKLYIDGSRIKARNYCRNLDQDPKGPFCYTSLHKKSYCKPRKCRMSECRMAGTGNDFIGKLNITRSNRICQKWTENSPHKVNASYLNETLYPDMSVENASNYCRDPSRNIAGTWCYTTDPDVVFDLCSVPDCSKPEQCTVLTRGSSIGRYIYILPQWKRDGLNFWLKEWDPDLTDGIIFRILADKEDEYYQLFIGAENNEKVYLVYNNRTQENKLKEKSLPHLIPIGKWAGFWLKTTAGVIKLGYIGVENPLFEWVNTNQELNFSPKFLTYSSLIGHTIGVSFKCNECHVENTSTSQLTRIFPISLWLNDEKQHVNNKHVNKLTLYLRGTGHVEVSFLSMIGTADYYGVFIGIGDNKEKLVWCKQTGKVTEPLGGGLSLSPLIVNDTWIKYTIIFEEQAVYFVQGEVQIFVFNHTHPLLFYFFGLAVNNGYVLWSANCEPGDIDPPARNGGWSDWGEEICSVTCGSGVGIETRTCTNPKPNILGNDCIGRNTRKGPCNIFPCGEISPDTQELLKHQLKTKNFNKIVIEDDTVSLENNKELLRRVLRESPKSEINWTHNGNILDLESDRIKIKGFDIIIKEANPKFDSGVYVCMITTPNDVRLVLTVVSVTVEPRGYSASNREGRYHSQLCNSLVLGYIYDNVEQRWELNGRVYKNYGITTPAAVNELRIWNLNKSHKGDWKCIVIQRELKFIWTTNWIKLDVKHAATFLTYLMEDSLPATFFRSFSSEKMIVVVLISVVVLAILLVSIFTVIYLKYFTLD